MKRKQYTGERQRARAYAPAVVTQGGQTVWLAGILAWEDENGASLAGDFKAQVRCIFRKMAAQMAQVGGRLDQVVTMTCYLTDVEDNTDFVEVRKEFFAEALYPASTLVTVKALNHPDAKIEVTATAVINEQGEISA